MKKLLEGISSPDDIKKFTTEQLSQLAEELRQTIINQVAQKGGHLASNLGVIELTLALHLEFQAPQDKIIWDVGHQAYPHKLLTGRYPQFHTLKQYGGLSGFLKRSESPYDVFGAGHASTSLAAAMGFASARTRSKQKHHVVAVIGDGSMTGGMALEALNNAGDSNENVIFILNDNRMSIAPNVGAIHRYLNHILSHPTYNRLKDDVWNFTSKFPQGVGKGIRAFMHKVDEGVKSIILPGGLFEDMGIKYFGPVHGHDLEEIRRMLKHLKTLNGPSILHIVTEKGHGFGLAVEDSYKWHASTPFDPSSGERKGDKSAPLSLAQVSAQTLLELAHQDPKLIAITAAMPDGTGLNLFEKELPQQFYDVGIAEQYAVTFAAGLACEGYKPVACIYSTFLQRAIDQIAHDVALQHLPVLFVMSHSGLVGVDGPTHHGTMDLSYLRMIPEMVIMAPSNAAELRLALYTGYKYTAGPFAVRFSKGPGTDGNPTNTLSEVPLGIPRLLEEGQDIVILAAGTLVSNGIKAREILLTQGLNPTLIDARFIKPLDKKSYQEIFQKHSIIVTLEDNVLAGGYGSGVNDLLVELEIFGKICINIGLPDAWVTHGDVSTLQQVLGMDPESIAKKITDLYNRHFLSGKT